jgi:predicted ATPase
MQLIIKNFGPIKQGQIDLTKKFYVFVGYNNTGKTYVSQLLWSIFNEQTIENFSEQVNIKDLNGEIEEKLQAGESRFDITPEIVEHILEEFARFLTHQVVPSKFNIDHHHVILEQFSVNFKSDINLIKSYQSISSIFLGVDVLTLAKEKASLTVKMTKERVSKPWCAVSNTPPLPLVAIFYKFMVNLLLNMHNHQPVFLPSSRLFYPLFYSYVYRVQKEKYEKTSKLIGDAFEKRQKGEPIDLESLLMKNGFESDYTEPMNVLFDKLYRLNEEMTVQNHYEHLASEMTVILGGDIVMSKKEGIAPIKFGFKPTQQDYHLPMFLSSSSVNQLCTLYLYFKYWVHQADNFLMIDEPEENLHPNNQIALLNVLLAFAAANNNKVLMITHSPLLAEAVNNYLHLFWLKSQSVDVNPIIADDYPDINPDIHLTVDDIAIYFFEGTRIIPYERGEYGVLFSDFNACSRKIKKISLALTDKVYQLLNDDDEE